jgi:hypothetical protein
MNWTSTKPTLSTIWTEKIYRICRKCCFWRECCFWVHSLSWVNLTPSTRASWDLGVHVHVLNDSVQCLQMLPSNCTDPMRGHHTAGLVFMPCYLTLENKYILSCWSCTIEQLNYIMHLEIWLVFRITITLQYSVITCFNPVFDQTLQFLT